MPTLLMVLRRLWWVITAPWRGWTEYQLAKLRVHAEMQAKPLETVLAMVKEMADTQREQTRVLQTWLEGFRVTEAPSSTTMRDEDELEAERARSTSSVPPAAVAKMFEDLVRIDALD